VAGCGGPAPGAVGRLARSLEKGEGARHDWQAGFEILRLAHDA
jgi:hypothetical protein